MAFTEKLPEWQAEGTEPPGSKKEAGWKVEDRPPASWWNWLLNRTYMVLKEIREKVAEKDWVKEQIEGVKVEVPDASLTQKGIVQLSNATDGTRETVAATEKAVKAAYDRGDVGATAAEKVQTNLDTHITDNAKHVPHLGTTTNTGDAYKITTSEIINNNQKFTIKFNAESTTAPTLSINNGTAIPIKKPSGNNAKLYASAYTLFKDGSTFILQGEGGDPVHGSKIYDVPGSYTFSIPPDVNNITLIITGGGGGGGMYGKWAGSGGGGGGAGGTTIVTTSVEGIKTISIVVGRGGRGAFYEPKRHAEKGEESYVGINGNKYAATGGEGGYDGQEDSPGSGGKGGSGVGLGGDGGDGGNGGNWSGSGGKGIAGNGGNGGNSAVSAYDGNNGRVVILW